MLKFLKKYRTLVKLAENHKEVPIVDGRRRHLGIILTFIGYILLAFYAVLFEFDVHRFQIKVVDSVSHVFFNFTILYFVMFLVFSAFVIPLGRKFLKSKEPKLLFWRIAIAITGFWAYSLSRVWTNLVDNSLLYSSDSIWIVLILWLLGIKMRGFKFWGNILGFITIIYLCAVNFTSVYSLFGWFFGTFSGITLAIITIITSYLVKQDPPLRIGFYQSLIACISSFIIAIVFGFFQGWSFPTPVEIATFSFTGLAFALAMFCFWEAFFYAETYIIGAVSYFYPVLIIVLGWVINENQITPITILGTTTLSIASLLIIFGSFFNDRKNKIKHFADGTNIPKIKK